MRFGPFEAKCVEGESDRLHPSHGEPAELHQLADAAPGEEPQVGGVEDAPLVVVEPADHGAGPRVPVADVRDAQDDGSFGGQHVLALLDEFAGLAEVLQHVGHEHQVESGPDLRGDPLSEVGLVEVAHPLARIRKLVHVHADDVVAHPGEALGQQPARAAQVQDLGRWPSAQHGGDPTVRAVLGRLELVLLVEGDPAAVAESGLLQAVGDDVLGDVLGISHAVDVADFISVVRGDRHLGDPHAGVVQLDDDLGIEVEPIGVLLERNPLERFH